MMVRKPQVSAGVSAEALRRSITILQWLCWSLRRSVAAHLLPQRTRLTLGTKVRFGRLSTRPVRSQSATFLIPSPNISSIACLGGELAGPGAGPADRGTAAPLQRCAQLHGVDLATICEAAANVEPYLRADGTRIWSLMQLERQLRPEVYGRRRGGYLDRRRRRQ
jgi:hypothetical protein